MGGTRGPTAHPVMKKTENSGHSPVPGPLRTPPARREQGRGPTAIAPTKRRDQRISGKQLTQPKVITITRIKRRLGRWNRPLWRGNCPRGKWLSDPESLILDGSCPAARRRIDGGPAAARTPPRARSHARGLRRFNFGSYPWLRGRAFVRTSSWATPVVGSRRTFDPARGPVERAPVGPSLVLSLRVFTDLLEDPSVGGRMGFVVRWP